MGHTYSEGMICGLGASKRLVGMMSRLGELAQLGEVPD